MDDIGRIDIRDVILMDKVSKDIMASDMFIPVVSCYYL